MDTNRQELIARARRVLDQADAEHRDLSDYESEVVATLLDAAASLARIDRLTVPLRTRGHRP